MKIIDGQPDHARGVLEVRGEARADTYANYATSVTREYLLSLNVITPELIDGEVKEIEHEDTRYWVVEDEDSIVGYLKARKHPKQSVELVHLLPSHQGQRLGSSLFAEAFEWFDLTQPVYIEVVDGNDRARQWYERLGWQPTGRVIEGTRIPDGGFIPEYELVLESAGGARLKLNGSKLDR